MKIRINNFFYYELYFFSPVYQARSHGLFSISFTLSQDIASQKLDSVIYVLTIKTELKIQHQYFRTESFLILLISNFLKRSLIQQKNLWSNSRYYFNTRCEVSSSGQSFVIKKIIYLFNYDKLNIRSTNPVFTNIFQF